MVIFYALEVLIKFITNNPTYRPLRATILGCGETEKLYIGNTLLSMVWRYTKRNDTIRVAAPTGSAACNVGGCTLHCCLNLSVDSNDLTKDLSTDKQEELAQKIKHVLILITDKKNMISLLL